MLSAYNIARNPIGTVIVIYSIDERSTRLVSRVRAHIENTPRGWFWMALLDLGQFVVDRRMLVEIKRRAERNRQ